jgi:hypothetical protein
MDEMILELEFFINVKELVFIRVKEKSTFEIGFFGLLSVIMCLSK